MTVKGPPLTSDTNLFRSLSKTDFSVCSQGLSCVFVQLFICFCWKVSASTYAAVEVTALLLIRQNTERKFHHKGWSVTSVVSSHVFFRVFPELVPICSDVITAHNDRTIALSRFVHLISKTRANLFESLSSPIVPCN